MSVGQSVVPRGGDYSSSEASRKIITIRSEAPTCDGRRRHARTSQMQQQQQPRRGRKPRQRAAGRAADSTRQNWFSLKCGRLERSADIPDIERVYLDGRIGNETGRWGHANERPAGRPAGPRDVTMRGEASVPYLTRRSSACRWLFVPTSVRQRRRAAETELTNANRLSIFVCLSATVKRGPAGRSVYWAAMARGTAACMRLAN